MNPRKLAPETLMISHGYHPGKFIGSVKCPLFLTSTFAFDTAEEGKSWFELAYGLREPVLNEKQGMIYSRLNNPNPHLAEQRLAVWEQAEDAAFFASGMAAISTTVFAFLRPGDLLLYSAPVYGGTDCFFNHVLPLFNIHTLQFVSDETLEEIARRAESEFPGKVPAMIFVESPGNPVNNLIDIAMCQRMADYYGKYRSKPLLVVDNTFLGPMFQKPLDHGADLSLYSATKFIGGHSDLIAGAIVGNKEIVSVIKNLRTFLGCMLDPHSGWLILRSLETLKIRMQQQAFNAKAVANLLQSHEKVKKVHYLGFLEKNSPQKEIFDRQCSSAGSMIAFEINGDEEAAFRFLNRLKLFKIAVSLGSTESLAEHPATMTHVDMMLDEKIRLGINEQLIRLSIGLENPDDLISDLSNALNDDV